MFEENGDWIPEDNIEYKKICSNKAVYLTARDASIWGLQISQFDQLKMHIPKSLPPSMKKKMNLKQVFVIFAFICKLSRKSREVQRSAFCSDSERTKKDSNARARMAETPGKAWGRKRPVHQERLACVGKDAQQYTVEEIDGKHECRVLERPPAGTMHLGPWRFNTAHRALSDNWRQHCFF